MHPCSSGLGLLPSLRIIKITSLATKKKKKGHRKYVACGDIIITQIIKIAGMRRNAGRGKGKGTLTDFNIGLLWQH